ncbi:sugar ABC transporter substrate-binding protein [Planomonospora parontospora subsp. parontospora]|uniref:Sugar ABC transporter substrate-binding protein n=2 Tax=Planomonospora parontospora TaxID=58119 RepID=A0AA37BE52_9ACTN|nr:extracellular solute-binding protein [Planomonospora parontospora]GGK56579.1 sugar ABC transporter substrate-binding protein [Planomonospora parontospora]GII07231.1 sugar ABC transporter substrate-binding protein [Planomonospora parontospora subsp. parontospora]
MKTPPEGATTSRRGFLGLVGLSAVAAASGGLLSACSTPSGPRPGSGGATAAAADKLTSLTPTYTAFPGVKPDLPGTVSNLPGVPDVSGGFTTYPASPVQALTQKAGKGGTYTAMTPLWGPLPPGLEDNSYFQAANADIGATVQFQITDGTVYADKAIARLASGDLPDIMVIPSWEIEKMADFNTAVDKAFEDLTPYLQGDKVKPYPLLANLPTAAWQWSVWNNKLMAVPFPTEPYPFALLYRKDIFDKNGWNTNPKTADELFELGKEITDPKAKRWAFGSIHEMMWPTFRIPQEWRYEGGKLVHKYETPEFELMLAFMQKVFKEELVHPEVVSSKGANEKDLMASGQILIYRDGLGGWKELLQQHRAKNPDFAMNAFPVFAHDGGTPMMYHGNAAGIFTFVKKGLPKEKVEEILSVLNWCAAPFGTKEYELSNFGVEGEHFKRGDNGIPELTDLGRKEVAYTYGFLGGRPLYVDWPYPDAVKLNVEWQNASFPHLEKAPFDGIRVQRPSRMSGLQVPTEDKFTDIMRGRRPVSDAKQIVAEWQRDGGNEARDFYMKVLQDNGRA